MDTAVTPAVTPESGSGSSSGPAFPDEGRHSRSARLLGDAAVRRLSRASVLVVGLGGVGGYAVEMLARAGVGHLTLVDADNVAESNLNRQIIATVPGIGHPKARLFAERIRDIDPSLDIDALIAYVTPENVGELLDSRPFDYVIDAIDTVAPKVALITAARERGIPLISSMGAGGRIDPTRIGYTDIWQTREDGLARAVRQRLKTIGWRHPLRVVASSEAPRRHAVVEVNTANKRTSYGTIAPIPSIFGIMLANHVILKLAGI